MLDNEKQTALQDATDMGDAEPIGLEKSGTVQDQKDMFRLGKKQQLKVREQNISIALALALDSGTFDSFRSSLLLVF